MVAVLIMTYEDFVAVFIMTYEDYYT